VLNSPGPDTYTVSCAVQFESTEGEKGVAKVLAGSVGGVIALME
jgi:hypothetical protein